MKEMKRLGKALTIILVVMLIPIVLAITLQIHKQQKADNLVKQQQNANVLLSEIDSDYYALDDMLTFFCENYSAPVIQQELEGGSIEKASNLFIRRGVPTKTLSGYFAWTFINERYEILHRNIANYNKRVSNSANTIKSIDDVPRVVDKFRGSV